MNPLRIFGTPKMSSPWQSWFAATFVAAFGASGCDKLKARDLLNKGVAAYRDGKFDSVHRGFQDGQGPRIPH